MEKTLESYLTKNLSLDSEEKDVVLNEVIHNVSERAKEYAEKGDKEKENFYTSLALAYAIEVARMIPSMGEEDFTLKNIGIDKLYTEVVPLVKNFYNSIGLPLDEDRSSVRGDIPQLNFFNKDYEGFSVTMSSSKEKTRISVFKV